MPFVGSNFNDFHDTREDGS